MATSKTPRELIDSGMAAYRKQQYQDSVQLLTEGVQMEPLNWQARLYLGIAHLHLGDTQDAQRHLAFVRDGCTDANFKQKAATALSAIGTSRISGIFDTFK